MSNLAKWAVWNASDEPAPYCRSDTYQLGAEWLAPCALVEDWGCGRGWMSTLIPPARYRGVDGSPWSPTAVSADLETYRSNVPGIFMRHVLEHNYAWRKILANLVASARERIFIALFTPLALTTRQIAYADWPGIPDLSFALVDLLGPLTDAGFTVEVEDLASPKTQYKVETVFRAVR